MTRALLAGLALALTLVLTGCGGDPAPAAGGPGSSAGSADVATPALVPASFDMASIGARSSLIPLGRDQVGGWAVPALDAPGQASWYSDGVAPGQVGRAVILGHINGCVALDAAGKCAGGQHAPGVFQRLNEAKVGDEATVTGTDGRTVEFRVTSVDQIPKGEFPTAEVLGTAPNRQLRLISCGGTYDPGDRRYLDNVIVTMVAFDR